MMMSAKKKRLCSLVQGFITDPQEVIDLAREVSEEDESLRMPVLLYNQGRITQEDLFTSIKKSCGMEVKVTTRRKKRRRR